MIMFNILVIIMIILFFCLLWCLCLNKECCFLNIKWVYIINGMGEVGFSWKIESVVKCIEYLN